MPSSGTMAVSSTKPEMTGLRTPRPSAPTAYGTTMLSSSRISCFGKRTIRCASR